MTAQAPLKVGISGVRGIVGESLTSNVAHAFARAFADFMPGKVIAVGRDTRTHGPMLQAAVAAGLMQGGKGVVDFDVLPIPSLQTRIRFDDRLQGGIYISASHNPGEYNGLKFYRADGVILHPEEADALIRRWERGRFTAAAHDLVGAPIGQTRVAQRRAEAIRAHIDRIAGFVDCDLIRRANLRVVMDCNNGAGCLATPQLLERLGVAEVAPINERPTGRFAHPPEPTPGNMTELAARVQGLGYDIGFSQDADADRVSIAACVQTDAGPVGQAIGEEYTLSLGAASVAEQAAREGVVVSMAANYSTSRMTEEIAGGYGFAFDRCAVGEINVVKRLMQFEREWEEGPRSGQPHFAFGGEGGGGIIDPRNQYCRDSLNSIALILQGLAQFLSGQVLPEAQRPADRRLMVDAWRKAAFRPCVIVKRSMEFADQALQDRVMQVAYEHYRKARVPRSNIRDDDGVRVKYADGSWVHVRPSNTEAIVRFIAEHDTRAQAERLVKRAMAMAEKALGG